jgi:hypothetical protein
MSAVQICNRVWSKKTPVTGDMWSDQISLFLVARYVVHLIEGFIPV